MLVTSGGMMIMLLNKMMALKIDMIMIILTTRLASTLHIHCYGHFVFWFADITKPSLSWSAIWESYGIWPLAPLYLKPWQGHGNDLRHLGYTDLHGKRCHNQSQPQATSCKPCSPHQGSRSLNTEAKSETRGSPEQHRKQHQQQVRATDKANQSKHTKQNTYK